MGSHCKFRRQVLQGNPQHTWKHTNDTSLRVVTELVVIYLTMLIPRLYSTQPCSYHEGSSPCAFP